MIEQFNPVKLRLYGCEYNLIVFSDFSPEIHYSKIIPLYILQRVSYTERMTCRLVIIINHPCVLEETERASLNNSILLR